MSAHQIALAALTLGICGLINPRSAMLVLVFAGVVYLSFGWVPFD